LIDDRKFEILSNLPLKLAFLLLEMYHNQTNFKDGVHLIQDRVGFKIFDVLDKLIKLYF